MEGREPSPDMEEGEPEEEDEPGAAQPGRPVAAAAAAAQGNGAGIYALQPLFAPKFQARISLPSSFSVSRGVWQLLGVQQRP